MQLSRFNGRACAAVVFLCAALGACALRPTLQDNPTLATLYAQDQADRRGVVAWTAETDARDADRRRQVREMLSAGTVRTAADHYHAAMVLQHGDTPADYHRAHELASTAERMGSAPARWLSAATLDRWLLSQGQPQRYGTQFTDVGGRWYLEPMDTLAVTDAERRRAGARTLDEIRAFLREKNGTAEVSLAPRPEPEPREGPAVELVDGLDALAARIVVPAAARAARVDGRVRVQLTVLPDGTVGEAVLVEGLGHGVDEEALRVVREARFINHVGEPHEIRIAIPITASAL
ncbi:TonB family protein [Longimicrobium sp.]|uniref:TonB family protein n=1 Tax=Longimicrobium sp. TaxID=2029185 RepID=UPI002E3707C8|nr:TonB family protein [Longimicrobium sp.]HEX6036703.1 TonB family protein [Longimicrobium sp.]